MSVVVEFLCSDFRFDNNIHFFFVNCPGLCAALLHHPLCVTFLCMHGGDVEHEYETTLGGAVQKAG